MDPFLSTGKSKKVEKAVFFALFRRGAPASLPKLFTILYNKVLGKGYGGNVIKILTIKFR